MRNCLLAPSEALLGAVGLLEGAAEAVQAGRLDEARELLRQADSSAIRTHLARVMGRTNPEVHGAPPTVRSLLPRAERDRRTSATTELTVFRRDGWRCRFCGIQVVGPKARARLTALLPDAAPWGAADRQKHAALLGLVAVADHVVPWSRGGRSEAANLVTACGACNYGRNNWTLDEVGVRDPRMRAPVVDGWDGLMRIADTAAVRGPRSQLGSDDRAVVSGRGVDWFEALEAAVPGSVARLHTFLDMCSGAPVTWSVRNVLVVRIAGVAETVDALGFEPSGFVQVPWMIRGNKAASRDFALAIAGAIPGAAAYENEKMWTVRAAHPRRRPPLHIVDVLNAAQEVRAALAALADTIGGVSAPRS